MIAQESPSLEKEMLEDNDKQELTARDYAELQGFDFSQRHVPKWLAEEAIDFRMEKDKVYGNDIYCFLVPLSRVERRIVYGSVNTSQVRPVEKKLALRIKARNQLKAQGQKESIAIKYYPVDDYTANKTGNGRHDSFKVLESKGIAIPNLNSSVGLKEAPAGYVWSHCLDFANDTDTFHYQMAHDVNHSAGENLTDAAFLENVSGMIDRNQGAFFGYSDKEKPKRKEVFQSFIQSLGTSCIFNEEKKIESLFRRLEKLRNRTDNGTEALTKTGMINTLEKNLTCLDDVFDLESLEKAWSKLDNRSNAGFILENVKLKDEQKVVSVGIYATELGVGSGAYYQGTQKMKYVRKEADYCILLMAFDAFAVKKDSTTKKAYENKIADCKKETKKWNDSLGYDKNGSKLKSIDMVVYINQLTKTASEKESMQTKPIYRIDTF